MRNKTLFTERHCYPSLVWHTHRSSLTTGLFNRQRDVSGTFDASLSDKLVVVSPARTVTMRGDVTSTYDGAYEIIDRDPIRDHPLGATSTIYHNFLLTTP